MPTAKVSDISMYYVITGEGPPLLMTPGWVMAERSFRGVIDEFAKHYTCIRHDHRNIGRSGAPDAPVTIEQMADDLAGLLDHLEIGRTRVLGGGGMGGLVGMELAIRHPEKVSALHIGSASLKYDNLGKEQMAIWKDLRRLDVRLWAREVTSLCYTPKTYRENPDMPRREFEARAAEDTFPAPGAFDRIVDAYVAYDGSERAGRISCPTLITSGDVEDLISGPRYTRAVHEAIPGSVFHIFPGTSHGYPGEARDEYVALLLNWFGKHGD